MDDEPQIIIQVVRGGRLWMHRIDIVEWENYRFPGVIAETIINEGLAEMGHNKREE